MTVSIERGAFRGCENTYRLGNDAVAARVVADVGPRVVELGPAGAPSLLYLRAREAGGRNEPTWRFRGGWRLWIAPERSATTYALDNPPCAVERAAPDTLRVVGPPQADIGIQKRITVRVDAEHPRFVVESRLRNVGSAVVVHAPWTLAVLRPGGRAFLPIEAGPPEALDAVRRLVLGSYARIDDPRSCSHAGGGGLRMSSRRRRDARGVHEPRVPRDRAHGRPDETRTGRGGDPARGLVDLSPVSRCPRRLRVSTRWPTRWRRTSPPGGAMPLAAA